MPELIVFVLGIFLLTFLARFSWDVAFPSNLRVTPGIGVQDFNSTGAISIFHSVRNSLFLFGSLCSPNQGEASDEERLQIVCDTHGREYDSGSVKAFQRSGTLYLDKKSFTYFLSNGYYPKKDVDKNCVAASKIGLMIEKA